MNRVDVSRHIICPITPSDYKILARNFRDIACNQVVINITRLFEVPLCRIKCSNKPSPNINVKTQTSYRKCMCPSADVGWCRTWNYYGSPSHFLSHKAFQTQPGFQIKPFRSFLPDHRGTREFDKVHLISLRMSLFAESPKASKLRVEDSIVNTWMSGG